MPIKLGEVEIEAESDRRDEVGGGAAAEVADRVEGGAAGQVVAFAAEGRLDVIELQAGDVKVDAPELPALVLAGDDFRQLPPEIRTAFRLGDGGLAQNVMGACATLFAGAINLGETHLDNWQLADDVECRNLAAFGGGHDAQTLVCDG